MPGDIPRILVVDDDEAVRAVSYEMLSRLGYDVAVADDGPVALTRMESQYFDAVLLDLSMPKMSGEELFETVRQRYPQTNVVLMTGFSRDEVEHIVEDNERTVFLPKPFQLSSLQRAVERALQRP